MSKADKMFEELGYSFKNVYGGFIYSKENKSIHFDFMPKYKLYTNADELLPNEIKAIHDKMKELGWLE